MQLLNSMRDNWIILNYDDNNKLIIIAANFES